MLVSVAPTIDQVSAAHIDQVSAAHIDQVSAAHIESSSTDERPTTAPIAADGRQPRLANEPEVIGAAEQMGGAVAYEHKDVLQPMDVAKSTTEADFKPLRLEVQGKQACRPPSNYEATQVWRALINDPP